MILADVYDDVVANRAAALDVSEPAAWPPLPLVLDRCVDRLVALVALFDSGGLGDGWDGDVAKLREVAANWTAVSDAFQIIERRESTARP